MKCIFDVLIGDEGEPDAVSLATCRKLSTMPHFSLSLRRNLSDRSAERVDFPLIKHQVLELLTKLQLNQTRKDCLCRGILEAQLGCVISRLKKAQHSIEMISLIKSEKFESFRELVDPKLCLTPVFDACWPSSSSFTGQHESLEGAALFVLEMGCPVRAKMAHAHSNVSRKWLRKFQDFDVGIGAFNNDLDREWRCEKIEIKYILYDFFPDDEVLCPIIMSFAYRDL